MKTTNEKKLQQQNLKKRVKLHQHDTTIVVCAWAPPQNTYPTFEMTNENESANSKRPGWQTEICKQPTTDKRQQNGTLEKRKTTTATKVLAG